MTQDKILKMIADDTKNSNDKTARVSDTALGTACIDLVTKRLSGERRTDAGESLKSAILSAIYEPERDNISTKPGILETPSARRQLLKEKLLSKITYPGILIREHSVVKAHEQTFQWIFRRAKQQNLPCESFSQWLAAPDKQLHWITGKAGSGKSTLMRYISQPPQAASDDPSNKPNG